MLIRYLCLINLCGSLLCLSIDKTKFNSSGQRSTEEAKSSVNKRSNEYDVFFSDSISDQYAYHNMPEHIINTYRDRTNGPFYKADTEQPNSSHRPNNEDELLVKTRNGYVRGRRFLANHTVPNMYRNKSEPRQKLNAWLGIPYAEKPINNLRFRRPVPVRNWNGVYQANHLQNTCYQHPDKIYPGFWGTELWNPNTNVSEDCLYLNVWTPSPKPKLMPVMVWIYGGSFLSGTSTLEIYDPKVIVAETNVVFVSLNYRVSIFGFLYLDHENAPGNMGLLDQNMALRWVYDNIEAFGGDPNKITLVGESAGSASVSLHLLSPLSRNIFKSAVMQSGGFLAEWATLEKKTAVKRYTETLEAMGCTGTKYEMIECAKKVSPKHAIDASDEYFYTRANHGIMQFPFLPVVDGYFLMDEPIKLVNEGKVKKCPIMLGVNKDEANWFYIYSYPEYRDLKVEPKLTYSLYKDFVKSLFHFYPQFPTIANQKIIDAIIYRYSFWDNVHNRRKNIELLDDAAADYHFICPALDMASTFAMNRQDVFFYHFTQRASNHMWPDYFGVLHADEIQFTFGQPLYKKYGFTRKERVFARKLLKYWSNFVRYDNPNGLRKNELNISTPSLKTYIEPWPKYRILFDHKNDRQKAYLELNADKNEIKYNLRADYCSFWGSYLPKLMLQDVEDKKQCETCETCPEKVNPVAVAKDSSSSATSQIEYLSKSIMLTALIITNYIIW